MFHTYATFQNVEPKTRAQRNSEKLEVQEVEVEAARQEAMTLEEVELNSIDKLTFVPSWQVRQLIYTQSIEANDKPSLCSKLPPPKNEDGEIDQKKYRDRLNPTNSILVKIATRQVPFGTVLLREDPFAVTADRYPALSNGSNGPNGVLISFGDGDGRRTNLFDTNDAKTKELLVAYLAFRDANKQLLFKKTVGQMETIESNPHYTAATALLKSIGDRKDFDDIIGVNSFCQSWATEEGVSGPQFSVESPHFQTRFFIKHLPVGTDPEQIEAYKQVIIEHDKHMTAYEGKFVNLDGLLDQLIQDIIWILGAPTSQTIKHIVNILTPTTKIIICASLTAYTTAMTTKNINDLPTNFRTHPGHVKMGDIEITDADSFKAAQEDTSNALVTLFNDIHVPIYFAIVPRLKRPTYLLQGVDGQIKATETDNRNVVLENADIELSAKILHEQMIPAFGSEAAAEKAMQEACSHHATYLADVLTVGCGLTEDGWISHSMVDQSIIAKDGTFPKKGFIDEPLTNVAYAKTSFVEDVKGSFQSFNESAVPQMTAALRQIINHPGVCFRNSTIFHDALLNDVDDIPAIHLITQCSERTELHQNYSKI